MNNGSLCSLVGGCVSTCGESVQLDSMDFKKSSCNLIYMDKVFSLNEKDTSPVTYPITSDTDLTYQFFTAADQNNSSCGCGCGCSCNNPCNDFAITAATTFNVTNASVVINSLSAPETTPIGSSNVTVNGFAVDSLTFENGQYLATINSSIDEILNCTCIEAGKPTMAFFMATNPNGWEAQLSIQVDGTLTNGSSTCCFRMCFTTPVTTPITITGSSTFAIPNVSLPCSVNGVAPVLRFRFGGCGTILNPSIAVAVVDSQLSPQLTGTIVVEPLIQLEVTRPTLFKINAAEPAMLCDQSANCSSCAGVAEANCDGIFDAKGCGCGCNSDCESTADQSCECGCGCDNNCFQCNDSNGYRW